MANRRRDFGKIVQDGSTFSIRWYENGKQRRKRGFITKTKAAAHLAKLRVQLDDGERPSLGRVVAFDVPVKDAIAAYGRYLLDDKGNKGASDTLYRLATFFPEQDRLLADLTPDICRGYYAALRTRVSPRTGKPFAVDSHRCMLAEAKSLLKWSVGKKWIAANPLETVEGQGKRRHGKPQLRIDEARRWMAKANELADTGDSGAVAAMVALLLGMRASEIISRVVRDLDDDGRQLWIPASKTEAGKRTLRVPADLRVHLLQLAANKKPDDLLFGEHWRDWIRKNVRRICELAGVPAVSAHSMRGLHATLATEAGVSGHAVAASLGQTSSSVTYESYATPGSVSAARQSSVLRVLSGGAE